MKNIKRIVILAVTLILSKQVISQTLNWASSNPQQKRIATVFAGWDYGIVGGVSYGYLLKTKIPIYVSGEYSFPAGKKLVDDFKTKLGVQMRLCRMKNFCFSTKINGVFRKYENPLVRLVNFGSDVTGIIGYYKPKWFIGVEFGFDKAIVTHFKHSATFKEIYPEVIDGWYEPATGGNVYYGLQTGVSIGRADVTLKAGRVITQDFKTIPFVPYHAQLGFNLRF